MCAQDVFAKYKDERKPKPQSVLAKYRPAPKPKPLAAKKTPQRPRPKVQEIMCRGRKHRCLVEEYCPDLEQAVNDAVSRGDCPSAAWALAEVPTIKYFEPVPTHLYVQKPDHRVCYFARSKSSAEPELGAMTVIIRVEMNIVPGKVNSHLAYVSQ